MPTLIRDVSKDELAAIRAINDAAMPDVNELSPQLVHWFAEEADYFRVATREGEVAGFLIALLPGHCYGSANYEWYSREFERFVYIDRVVVAGGFRGLGIGNVLYADVQSFAEQRAPRLTCEVYLEPRNDVSLLFHGAQGFAEVGQQRLPDGRYVSLLAKDLPSFDFVERHYGGPSLETVPTGRRTRSA